MPEPDLTQQQRAILRAFRQVTAERVQAEADAEARRKAERAAAENAQSQARQTADNQVSEARKAQEQAQDSLDQVGLADWLDTLRVAPTPRRDWPGCCFCR